MLKFLHLIYIAWAFSVFVVLMLVMLPFILAPLLFGTQYGRISFFFIRQWAYFFGKLSFIRYKVQGKEYIDPSKPYIFISNHTSFLDAPALPLSIPVQFRPLAKKSLLNIPVFGWIVKGLGITVDRSSAESRQASKTKLKSILERNISILIFPEGTQNRTNELLTHFYDGAFQIAIDTQTPLLPLVIEGAGKLMPPGKLSIRPGKIHIHVLPEIPVINETIESLKEKSQEAMLKILSKAN